MRQTNQVSEVRRFIQIREFLILSGFNFAKNLHLKFKVKERKNCQICFFFHQV